MGFPFSGFSVHDMAIRRAPISWKLEGYAHERTVDELFAAAGIRRPRCLERFRHWITRR